MEALLRRELVEKIQAIELGRGAASPSRTGRGPSPVPTGWPGVDEHFGGGPGGGLGGLPRAAVHEWFAGEEGGGRRGGGGTKASWRPPVALFVHLAWRALESEADPGAAPAAHEAAGREGDAGLRVLWIGRSLWPYPHALVRENLLARGEAGDRRLLHGSIFVDPPDDASRLWAIDLALRCSGVAAVIADGRGFGMAETRRLQLAARSGGTLALLARPACERRKLSAASTRWIVRPEPSASTHPRWTIRLLRCKEACGRVGEGEAQAWSLEWDDAKGAVVGSPEMVGRARAKTRRSGRFAVARQSA